VLGWEVEVELLDLIVPIGQPQAAEAPVHLHILAPVIEDLLALKRLVGHQARQIIL